MRKGTDLMIVSGILMAVIVGSLFYAIKTTGYAVAADNENGMEQFARCVYESGATVYISLDPESQEQMNMFGEYSDSIKYVICEGACERRDITKFPTWVIEGSKYESELSLDKISELTGCKI